MMNYIIVLLAVMCCAGIFSEEIGLGLVFVFALFIVVWTIVNFIKKNDVSEAGLVAFVVGLLSLAYSVCVLFFNIDLMSMLQLESAFEAAFEF